MKKGFKFSDEERRKMSERRKGLPSKLKGRHLSEAHKMKISRSLSVALVGHKLPEETKEKISKSVRKAMQSEIVKEKCRLGGLIANQVHGPSKIEFKVKEQLDKYGVLYIHQKPIANGHFILDFWLPEYQLVIECNGDYWHSKPDKIARDKELEKYVLSKGKDILWLWEHEINDEWFDIADFIEVFKES